MYTKILVPMDGSDSSHRALSEAVNLAGLTKGSIRVIYIIDEPAVFGMSGYFDPTAVRQAMQEEAAKVLEEARQTLAASSVAGETQVIESIDAGHDISHSIATIAAEYGADLVVMGTHGRRGVRRMVIGSVAERYVRLSTCPVLLIRADDGDASTS